MMLWKRYVSMILAIVLMVLYIPTGSFTTFAESATEFLSGDGTEDNPYLISDKNHLNNVRNHLDAHFKLVSDIEFTQEDFFRGGTFYNDRQYWEPIGEDNNTAFTGVFDGDGHTIKGLRVNLEKINKKHAGLFGYNTGTIKNLGILECIINAYDSITSSINSDNPLSSDSYAGGIVGINAGTISNCYNTGRVSAYATSSFTNNHSITSCYSYSYAGGIAGNNSGTIIDCYNNGSVFSSATASSSAKSSSPYNRPYYRSCSYAGGIAGSAYGEINNCNNTGSVSATSDTTSSDSNSIDNSYSYAGGIVGSAYGEINNCNTDSVSATSSNARSSGSSYSYSGGIAGFVYDKINNCNNTGSVSATYSSAGSSGFSYSYSGGIAGFVYDKNAGTINNCYNTGNISADYCAGGIAGKNAGTINNCYNTGNISASSYAGGITAINTGTTTGTIRRGTISNCYNTGNISANACAGGIAGENAGTISKGTISNCYNIGSVSVPSSETKGGIVGRSSGTISNCYYVENFLKGTGDGVDTAVKCSVDELMQQKTFVGFDFITVWEFIDSNTYPFPTLQAIPYSDTKEENTTEFAGGTGTPYNPYLISDKSHLNNVRKHCYAHFKLVSDIEFTQGDFAEGGTFYNGGDRWYPIGNHANPFAGMFDGNGHTIKGLTIYRSSEFYGTIYIGLFGCNTGIIKNLGILESSISARDSKVCAGGLVGENAGTISNCYNTGSVLATGHIHAYCYSYAGGIVGYNSGTIRNCYNTGSIDSYPVSTAYYPLPKCSAGGITGNNAGTISNCYNTGNISAYVYAGGITGENAGTISNCYNTGGVTDRESHNSGGGIAENNSGTISNCYYLDVVFQGVKSGVGHTVKCTAKQLMQPGTFLGFDFESIWTMTGNKDYLYPELKDVPMKFEKEVASIQVTAVPTKTKYVEFKDNLDVSNGEITVYYNNDTFKKIPLTAGMVSGFDNTKVGKRTLTVKYGGKSTTFEVEIIAKSVANIKVSTLPEKLEYLVGKDKLDVSGGKISVYYNNDTFEEIDLTAKMVTGFDNTKVGTQTLTVTYGGKSATFEVEIMTKSVDYIKISTFPEKLEYLAGEEQLDVTGGKIIVYYNNDTFEEIDLTADMVTDFDDTKVGTQTLTVTYGGRSTTFEVEIIVKSIEYIDILSLPEKLKYIAGKDTLDVTGGKIIVYYNNDTFNVIDLIPDMVTGFDNTIVGKQILKITCQGYTITFEVEIIAKSLTEIKVTKQPDKLTYLEGEKFDPTGMEIIAYYNNGTYEVVTDYEISGYNSKAGTKVITVTYGGKTTSFTVSVKNKTINRIEVSTKPNKLVYLKNKETLDVTGGKITVYYNNGTSEVIDLAAEMVLGFDNTKVGTQILTVTFGDFTTTFGVEIIAKSIDYFFLDNEVIIVAPSGVIPEDSTFDVQKIVPPPQEIVDEVKDQFGSSSTVISHYEFRLATIDGSSIIHLDGEITIKVKMPKYYVGSKCINILQEDEHGKLIEMTSWWEDDYLCYKTDWLEIY